MFRLLRTFAPALVAALLLPALASAAVRGLVIKNNGSVQATVVDGVVTGEISIPPGQISDPLEVFWLDDALAEYQPSAPPFSMQLVDGDPQVVTTTLTGTWTYTVTGHDPGESETTFILLDNGSPVFTSVPVPTHSEEAHVEADGFVLRQNGVDILREWRGTTTGELSAHLGQTSPTIEVIFLSPDSLEFIPDEPEFELRLDIADSSVVKWRSVDQWTFQVVGAAVGSTTFTLNVHHVDHDDFVSPSLPAHTYASVGVSPRVEVDGLALSSPFPNPVRSSAAIRFSLPSAQVADLAVYDVSGRKVAQLLTGMQSAGNRSVNWNTNELRPGLYLVRLRTPAGDRVSRAVVSR